MKIKFLTTQDPCPDVFQVLEIWFLFPFPASMTSVSLYMLQVHTQGQLWMMYNQEGFVQIPTAQASELWTDKSIFFPSFFEALNIHSIFV